MRLPGCCGSPQSDEVLAGIVADRREVNERGRRGALPAVVCEAGVAVWYRRDIGSHGLRPA
eukprot:2582946-Pyramimonas_sp.AAC.1